MPSFSVTLANFVDCPLATTVPDWPSTLPNFTSIEEFVKLYRDTTGMHTNRQVSHKVFHTFLKVVFSFEEYRHNKLVYSIHHGKTTTTSPSRSITSIPRGAVVAPIVSGAIGGAVVVTAAVRRCRNLQFCSDSHDWTRVQNVAIHSGF